MNQFIKDMQMEDNTLTGIIHIPCSIYHGPSIKSSESKKTLEKNSLIDCCNM